MFDGLFSAQGVFFFIFVLRAELAVVDAVSLEEVSDKGLTILSLLIFTS